MSGGGGGGESTTVQNIPTELKPLATKYASDAINLSNNPYQAYGGQRFADVNNTQQAGLDAITQRATQGSGTINNAEAALNQNITGGQTNPYLDQMVGRAQDSVRSQFNTGAVNSGSFGNSGLQEQFQKGLGDVASQMYGNAYEGDRARQMQSIGMAQQVIGTSFDHGGRHILDQIAVHRRLHRWCRRYNEAVIGKMHDRAEHDRQHPRDLLVSASWKQGDHRPVVITWQWW